MTPVSVCVGQQLTTVWDDEQQIYVLQMAPCSVPQLVADARFDSGADGNITETTTAPGKLLIDGQLSWRNNTPVVHNVVIRVTRRYRHWITSNPNAVQFRDRWTWGIDTAALTEPITTSIYNGQVGSANDIGTNTVAEPNQGLYEQWWGTGCNDEWVGPINPGSILQVWYRCYVWTPPPWSDNANLNNPKHLAEAGWTRVQLIAYPNQGALVSG